MFVTFHQINCGLPLPSQEDVVGVGCDVLTCRASQYGGGLWGLAGSLLSQLGGLGWACAAHTEKSIRNTQTGGTGCQGTLKGKYQSKVQSSSCSTRVKCHKLRLYRLHCAVHTSLLSQHSHVTPTCHLIQIWFFFEKKIVGPWIEKSRFIRISATGFLVMDGQLQSCAVAPRSWSTADNPAVISCH